MIKYLNVRLETIKLLEKNRTLFDINYSKILFDAPPRVMEIKTKIKKWDLAPDLSQRLRSDDHLVKKKKKKWDLLKLRSFCTINKMKS